MFLFSDVGGGVQSGTALTGSIAIDCIVARECGHIIENWHLCLFPKLITYSSGWRFLLVIMILCDD